MAKLIGCAFCFETEFIIPKHFPKYHPGGHKKDSTYQIIIFPKILHSRICHIKLFDIQGPPSGCYLMHLAVEDRNMQDAESPIRISAQLQDRE